MHAACKATNLQSVAPDSCAVQPWVLHACPYKMIRGACHFMVRACHRMVHACRHMVHTCGRMVHVRPCIVHAWRLVACARRCACRVTRCSTHGCTAQLLGAGASAVHAVRAYAWGESVSHQCSCPHACANAHVADIAAAKDVTLASKGQPAGGGGYFPITACQVRTHLPLATHSKTFNPKP